jgi:RHS repeat-associated protein
MATWQTSYSYSAEGDLLAMEGTGGRTRYNYDPAHRLLRETLPNGQEREFAHDLANNLIRQPGLKDVSLLEGNRFRWANGDRFTYSERNHISARQGPETNYEFEYDSLDRLIACTINGERWTARYDPLCRLVSKTWRGQMTTYYWDDFRLAAEVRPSGAVRLYLYVHEIALVPFMFLEYESLDVDPTSGQSYFVFTNQIGVPVRVEDIHGREAWHGRVDPYGMVHVRPGSRIDMPLRFPGHYYIAELGLHYNRFRYYSPEIGRYLQSDPLGIEGGLNLYGYCSSPLIQVDIDGLARHPGQRSNGSKGNKEGTSVGNVPPPLAQRPPPPPPFAGVPPFRNSTVGQVRQKLRDAGFKQTQAAVPRTAQGAGASAPSTRTGRSEVWARERSDGSREEARIDARGHHAPNDQTANASSTRPHAHKELVVNEGGREQRRALDDHNTPVPGNDYDATHIPLRN